MPPKEYENHTRPASRNCTKRPRALPRNVIKTASKGEMTVELPLLSEVAPRAVNNFVFLSIWRVTGFTKTTSFHHRVNQQVS